MADAVDRTESDELDEVTLARADREGLIRPEHLDLYLMWKSLGGFNQGIGLTELMGLDSTLVADFQYLVRCEADARKRKRQREELLDPPGPGRKKSKRR